MEQFQKDISVLETVSVNRAYEAIANKEHVTFFFGRGTCPYCRRFATKLHRVVIQTQAKVFFVNSENFSELDKIQAFRSEYNIPTVPGFVHVHNGEVIVRCDSSMSEDEIKQFMHL